MRSTIKPGLSSKVNNINKFVRLVLTETGPQYHNAVTVGSDVPVRRVGNLFYTKGFANLLFRELMMTKGRLEEASHTNAAGVQFARLRNWQSHAKS